MSSIAENLLQVRQQLQGNVRLVAVSKYHTEAEILEAYHAGQRIFGESRVQELQVKRNNLPKDIQWHFIGHLQLNKVKYIAEYIHLIHAVDSLKLLEEINKQAGKYQRVIPCLLQLHVAQEETKYGFTVEECNDFLERGDWKDLENVRIAGIMCMATNTDDKERIRRDFHTARSFYEMAKERHFAHLDYFKECSWGMSNDYGIAIEEGSTMIRVGSRIFGER